MSTVTLGDATNIVIYMWTKYLNLMFNDLSFDGGVTVGWIVVGVFLISMLLATILSRPISGITSWRKESKEDERSE